MSQLEIIRPRQLTRWQRFGQALRSITLGPYNSKDPELARLFGGRPALSGVAVDENSVMSLSAVWAAVNLVSAHISSVPLVLYKVLPDGGKDRFVGHPLYRLIHDRPNPIMGSALFRRTVQANKMVWNNGYAEIERDGAGRPVALWPLLSYRMQPFFQNGALKYRYQNQGGTDVIFEPMDVIHLRGYSETGIEGQSVTAKGRESFGLAMAAERFGGAFFGNGATFDHAITYPEGVNPTPQTRKENREALNNRHQGVDRSYRMLALYEGAKIQQMGVPPNEAQFLETRMFQIEEVARWFNIPPHKLKHLQRTSYNSIEHQSIEYVTDALDPDWVLWEQELNLKLVSSLEINIQRIEHIREGMLRGDSAARSQLQGSQFTIAAITSNEVREQENRNPVPGGNIPFVALNLIPLDLARPYWEAQIEKAKQPPPAPVPPQGQSDEAKDEEVKAARARAQAAEDARDLALDNARRADERAELIAVAHTQDRERYQQEVRQLGDALAEANTSIHDAASREQALDVERAAAQSQCADAERAANEQEQRAIKAESERDQWKATAGAEAQATNDAVQSANAAATDRDAALALAEEAARERDRANVEAAEYGAAMTQARRECDSERERRTAAQEAITLKWEPEAEALMKDRDAALALIEKTVQQRDAERAEVSRLREVCAGYDFAVNTFRDQKTAAEAAGAVVIIERDTIQAEAETLRADLARARAGLATELDSQQKQKAVTLAAMRSLFVDASERLLQKESDRARKHQATGEKLRAWVETFYPMHVETTRAVFRPLVGAWSAVTGGDPAELLERLASAHIGSSRQAFARVLDAEDDDERAELLERTLRRWEDERAEAMADALVREGMGQHG